MSPGDCSVPIVCKRSANQCCPNGVPDQICDIDTDESIAKNLEVARWKYPEIKKNHRDSHQSVAGRPSVYADEHTLVQ
jgi:hypothetical protein